MFELKGKVALVTGARRGIGKAISLALAKAGAKIVVTDIDEKECQEVVEEIKKADGEAMAKKIDVTNKKEIEEAVKQATDKFGKLDILVNNAGICPFKPFLELTEEDWDRVLDINLKGYFLCAQTAAKEMIKQNRGRIINIASVAMGQQGIGFPNIVHYVASKGGVVGMTEALAVELAPYGINVNAVSPGVIETKMAESMTADPSVKESTLKRVPKGRIGQPLDIAHAVVYLASEEADYVTGAVLIVDGGWLAG